MSTRRGRPVIHCVECGYPIKSKPWTYASGSWEHRAAVPPQDHRAKPSAMDLDALAQWRRS